HARPASHSCYAKLTRENEASREVVDLLRDRALAGGCPARQARPRRGCAWPLSALRKIGLRTSPDNGRSLRLPRVPVRAGHCADADESGPVLEWQLRGAR